MQTKTFLGTVAVVAVIFMGMGCSGTSTQTTDNNISVAPAESVAKTQGKAITDQDTDASIAAYRKMLVALEAPLDNIYENVDLAVNGWRFFYQDNEYGSHQDAMAISPGGQAIFMNNDTAENPIREFIETNKNDLPGMSRRILWLAEDGATYVDNASVESQYKTIVMDPTLATDDSGALVLKFWAILRDIPEPIQYIATAPVSGKSLVEYKMITK